MKKYQIGIEVALQSLRLAVVMHQQAVWRVVDTAELRLDGGDVQKNLRTVLKNIAPRIRQIILGLPQQRVLMKEIFIDSSLTRTEVYQYLQQQALALFGKPANHWIMDCEAHENGFRAAAAEREYVSNWLHIFRQLGMRVLAVDIDVLALARLTPTLADYQPDHTQALLWLRADELKFIAVKEGRLIYVKSAAYDPATVFTETVPPLLQFFNGLYPHLSAPEILVIGDHPPATAAMPLKIAALNPDIWRFQRAMQPQAYCSLGLAIYGY
jgi:Tfp pilus assembly PilM family ATPase